MRRDFGLHFAAWFLVGTPFYLLATFFLKPSHAWIAAAASRTQAFCYFFVAILCISFACAFLDCFVIGRLLRRFRTLRATSPAPLRPR